jgi:hypothetical protein
MTATSPVSNALADGIIHSAELLRRYLPGFDDSNATRQAPSLPNHATWCMGHLAVTMHRIAERISQKELPLGWDPEPFAFGSKPEAARAAYPSWVEVNKRFDAAVKTLADVVRGLSEDDLARTIPWGTGTITARDAAIRMVFHNGTHTGQIADLRRALGMERVIK